MSKSKSLRHHHTHRQIKKRTKDLRYILSWNNFEPFDKVMAGKNFKMRITTPTLCSCWLCGNPRKFYGNGKDGKTLQELKAVNDEQFGLMDYYCDKVA